MVVDAVFLLRSISVADMDDVGSISVFSSNSSFVVGNNDALVLIPIGLL